MFQKGQSGNPAGRKPGEGPFAKYRRMLASRSEELINQVIDLALAGDTTALKMCLDRLFPPLKPVEPPVKFPLESGSLTHMGAAVLSALGGGILSPEQGSKLVQALTGQARLIEVEELERRIAALEDEAHAKY